jgi:TRAP-type transport system periplasmic protein
VAKTLRIAGYQGEASVHTRGVRHLAAALAPHGFVADIIPDVTTQGKQAADLLVMIESGEVELGYFNASYLAPRVANLGVFDMPFALSDRQRIFAPLDGEIGARLAAEVAVITGLRVLGYWDNGFRHISNRLRPIRGPEDCRGLRIRTLNSPLHQRIFAAMGFDPVVIDVRHLAEAVHEHKVDAQENPLTNLVNFDLQRTHRHVSLTAHFFGIALLLANRRWFDGLPNGVQTTLRSAAADATAVQRAFAMEEDSHCITKLQADGVAIVPEHAIDRAAFRAAVADILKDAFAGVERNLQAAFISPG